MEGERDRDVKRGGGGRGERGGGEREMWRERDVKRGGGGRGERGGGGAEMWREREM